jgi:hypothetical protein
MGAPMANLMAAFDVTRVYRYRPDANQAMCDCGWEGERRRLRRTAVRDAYRHCAATECDLGRPLVLRGY